MIAYVTGKILALLPKSCVVLTPGGTGYEIFLPERALGCLPAAGEDVEFFIQTVVREDTLDLYGFVSLEEREMFSLLLSIHQLGPKTALAVLSCFDPATLQQIVAQEDYKALCRVPGIGEKTSKRVLWDLKDRLRTFIPSSGSSCSVSAPAKTGVYEDVCAGLSNLGYREDEVSSALVGILEKEPDLDVAGGIRAVLKFMAVKRGV
ncbi:MAG: Holliday junction branch migration protein RuvA [Desulfovibrionales bacterium]